LWDWLRGTWAGGAVDVIDVKVTGNVPDGAFQ